VSCQLTTRDVDLINQRLAAIEARLERVVVALGAMSVLEPEVTQRLFNLGMHNLELRLLRKLRKRGLTAADDEDKIETVLEGVA
jgi:hypothetical protein